MVNNVANSSVLELFKSLYAFIVDANIALYNALVYQIPIV